MNLLITRHLYAPNVTLGKLSVGNLLLATLEEPWSADPDGPGGQRRQAGKPESCVPDGKYDLHPHNGDRFKRVWCLVNNELGVYKYDFDIPMSQKWGRASVLIHSGNTTDDILGCILVGLHHGELKGKPAVLDSRIALEQLRRVLGAGMRSLEIRPAEGVLGTT
jgi:hypothetical protein